MSHVVKVELHITDLDALAKAAEMLGLEFKEGQKTFAWFGQHVGDYPLPEGFKASDMGKCDHALTVKNNDRAYGVGVCARRDGKPGYCVLFDFWAGGNGLVNHIGPEAKKLKQAYAVQVARKALLKAGNRVDIQQKGGKYVLVGRK